MTGIPAGQVARQRARAPGDLGRAPGDLAGAGRPGARVVSGEITDQGGGLRRDRRWQGRPGTPTVRQCHPGRRAAERHAADQALIGDHPQRVQVAHDGAPSPRTRSGAAYAGVPSSVPPVATSTSAREVPSTNSITKNAGCPGLGSP
jgi:hypothetical protein